MSRETFFAFDVGMFVLKQKIPSDGGILISDQRDVTVRKQEKTGRRNCREGDAGEGLIQTMIS